MAQTNIEGLTNATISNIKQIVDVNTIIGDPVLTEDGTTIIPVSKVTFGIGTGGSDFSSKNASDNFAFGGGAGAGVTITPVAFLICKNESVNVLQLSNTSSAVDKAIALIPEMVDKIANLIKEKKSKE